MLKRHSKNYLLLLVLQRLPKCLFVLGVVLMGSIVAVAEVESPEVFLRAIEERVSEAKLRNGIRVVAYRRGNAPVFSGVVSVRVGGVDEVVGKTGVAHLLEHMAFKGTSTIGAVDPKRERELLREQELLIAKSTTETGLDSEERERLQAIRAELDKLVAGNQFAEEYSKRGGVGLNATTDKELTQYFVSLPKGAFEFWCWQEAERLIDPVFRQFYEERNVVIEERRMRTDDSPAGKLYEDLLATAYQIHPYRNPVVGYREDLEKLTATDIETFHKQHYVPGNIVIAIVGDIDLERDLPILERYFGRLPARKPHVQTIPAEPPQTSERVVELRKGASPELLIAYHKPPYPDPRDPPLSMLEEVFAGSPISPLFEILVKKKRVAVGVSVEEAPGSLYPNLIIFSITPRAPYGNSDVLQVFDDTLADFLAKGPSVDELDYAKRAIAVSYLERQRSNLSLALGFASSTLIYGTWRAHLDWFEEAMKVSVDDIVRYGREFLVPTNRIIARLEPQGGEAAR